METAASRAGRVFRFGQFAVSEREGELRKNGERVKLQEQPLQVLVELLANAGTLVTREHLRQKLWPSDTFVDFDAGLNTAIRKIRQALNEDADHPIYIETQAKRGYRFIAPVAETAGESGPTSTTGPPAPAQTPGNLPRFVAPKPSKKRGWIALMSLAAIAIVAGCVVWYRSVGHPSKTSRSAAKPSPQTIAVLPFHDISAMPSDSWAIGMTDAIISRLTSLQNLAVRPTISVLKYAKELPEPVDAAKALGVENVLEGTYQREPGVTRVNVQLVDGRTGNTKWAQRYDLHSADVLSFEDQVASKVVEGLQVQISPAEQKSLQEQATTSPEAYNDYLQARYYWNEYFVHSKPDSLEKGEKLLLRALAIDPNFADAYALLGDFYAWHAANFVENSGANLKNSEMAALNALRLNPQSAEGLVALGGAYSEEGREAEAIRTLRKAVAVAPNNQTAWQLLGYAYYYAGLDELAEKMYRHAIEIDPAPQEPHWMHARMLLYIGKAHDAEEEMRQVLVTNPDQFKALAHLGSFLYYQGRLDEAEKNLDRAVELARGSGDYAEPQLAAIVYASRNEREKIDPRLFQYRPEEVIDGDVAYYLGGINALLGRRKAALKWLRRTVELGDVNYPWFQRDKTYDKLRADPEYQSIMAGVRQRWEANKREFDLAH